MLARLVSTYLQVIYIAAALLLRKDKLPQRYIGSVFDAPASPEQLKIFSASSVRAEMVMLWRERLL